MQVGMIGLGRMGGNMVRRLLRGGHECVIYDRRPEVVSGFGKEGAGNLIGVCMAIIGGLSIGAFHFVNRRMQHKGCACHPTNRAGHPDAG